MLVTTARLTFGPFSETDSRNLYALDNDPLVMIHINGGVKTSATFIKENIVPLFVSYGADVPEFGFWKVSSRQDGRFLGWVCLRPTTAPNQARVGYRFRQDCWGQGIATEAARTMVDIGFNRCGLQSIIATTYEHNKASQRVLQKLGFKFLKDLEVDFTNAETTAHDPSIQWDGVDKRYILLKNEWASKTSLQS